MSTVVQTPVTVLNAVAVSSTTAYPSIVSLFLRMADLVYTFDATSTATGSVQVWVNNKDDLEYAADVTAAGSEAANVAGWCMYGAAVSITAALKTSIPISRFVGKRIRLVYTNATSTGTVTSRLSFCWPA
jgi:hypothetical protein